MKATPSRSGNVPRRQAREADQERKPLIRTKRARFNTLVARYYPSVYIFASRLTDDPREAIVLTREAFDSTRKQLGTICDENLFASILVSTVIRRL
jgi:hypothetical protein